jgi:hypothetical protein
MCLLLATSRCAAIRGSRLAFVLARESRLHVVAGMSGSDRPASEQDGSKFVIPAAGLLSLEIRFSVSAKADREGVFVGRSRGGAEVGAAGKEATYPSMASGAGRARIGPVA